MLAFIRNSINYSSENERQALHKSVTFPCTDELNKAFNINYNDDRIRCMTYTYTDTINWSEVEIFINQNICYDINEKDEIIKFVKQIKPISQYDHFDIFNQIVISRCYIPILIIKNTNESTDKSVHIDMHYYILKRNELNRLSSEYKMNLYMNTITIMASVVASGLLFYNIKKS